MLNLLLNAASQELSPSPLIIEKPSPEYPGEWIINGDRWKEYGHEFTAAELAELSGKSVQSVYNLARKLDRLPTPDELKAVRRGAPRKYH